MLIFKHILPGLISCYILLSITPITATAQDSTRFLSMEEAVQRAVKNNRSVRLAALDEHVAGIHVKQAEDGFSPRVGFSYTALATNNPLNAFGFKLQQKSIAQSDFNPTLLNHPSATTDFITKLEVQQPLINTDLIYMRKAAQKETYPENSGKTWPS